MSSYPKIRTCQRIYAWVNTEKTPLHDPRMRRAMHMAVDRQILVDVVKDVAPMMVGGVIYPFSEWTTPMEELTRRLGYQRDPKAAIQEAQRLIAAAGYPNGLKNLDFLVWGNATCQLWAVAIQAMLKDALNIEANLRTVQNTAWIQDAQAGNFDLAIRPNVSSLMDPSDYFHAWYGKDGPQNHSKWSNNDFQSVVQQLDRETDVAQRKALVRQAEDILEQDPPLLPVAWEKINDGWHTYVQGHHPAHNFGMYDVVRQDTVWLDK